MVGGGPSGLIAAEVLADAGWAVTVYDHMVSVGRKLLLAGRGGLNLTHSEPFDELIGRYGEARTQLEPALRAWGVGELRAWCAGLGEATFVGSSGRVFPSSFRATPLLRAWLARLRDAGVVFETRHRFIGFGARPGSVRVATPSAVFDTDTDVVVLALGGASWPRVGSDGGWEQVLRDAGVDVAPLRPANCGLRFAWRSEFVGRHEGSPVKNVSLAIGGVAIRGDLVITSAGIEGGPVYAVSAVVRDAIERTGTCTVTVDLQPDRSAAQLVERLDHPRDGQSTSTLLRRAAGLSPAAAAFVREVAGRHLPTDLLGLAALLKALPFTTTATMPIERAISSAGGVRLDEVDERFMIRRVPGVFVAGEMIDWEAPTGGYLLQASFSTGVAAARGAIDWFDSCQADPR